ncbi:MAG: hypothetical protein AMJ79_04320 [Phycisphaerae bacterium SM23_30]|nr:MAG: hypothetical protein AMJ79_04320 [Phycisphaerae bacterium SM23_30]
MKGSDQNRPCRFPYKIFILSILLFFVWRPGGNVLGARQVNVSQVRKLIEGWLEEDGRPLGAELGRQIRNIESYTDNQGDPLYYIVNLHPTGFVIAAGDDEVEPIIGFVETGCYNSSIFDPLGSLVSGDLKKRVSAVRERRASPEPGARKRASEAQAKWRRLMGRGQGTEGSVSIDLSTVSDIRVAPLLQSQWDKSVCCTNPPLACYNYYTPTSDGFDPRHIGDPNNYPCGSIATAMAQLMAFHQHPTGGIGIHFSPIWIDGNPSSALTRGGDGSGGAYNWSLIQSALRPGCYTSPSQREAIGALCYDAGISVNMRYEFADSWSYLYNAAEALRDSSLFNYRSAVYADSGGSGIMPGLKDMINPNLDYGHPVILGLTSEHELLPKHTVIADGYGYQSGTLYHHINMGRSGIQDGWYNFPFVAGYTSITCCVYNIFVWETGEIISGRILDKNGNPMEGVTVVATGPGGVMYITTTNSLGIYVFADLDPNTIYTITAYLSGFYFSSRIIKTGRSQDYSATPGNLWDINLQERLILSYVDDDAPNDPGAGDPQLSDPLENGTLLHPYDAIQEAVDMAAERGVIIVLEGTYRGQGNRDINLKDKAITLRSTDPNDPAVRAATIIDCEGSVIAPHRGFHFGTDPNSLADPNTAVKGLTIRNGYAYRGGAIYSVDSSATFINCSFNNNQANFGGALSFTKGQPHLINCAFSDNTANAGGGIWSNRSGARLINCTFSGNSAPYGGGMYNQLGSCPELINCIFNGNSAHIYGGGMHNYNSDPMLVNCIFSGNSSDGHGGGMDNYLSNPALINCTFSENAAANEGGGIYNNASSPTLTNCILWHNRDVGGMEESAQIHNHDGFPAVTFSCVQDLYAFDAIVYPGTGNIDDDPLFKDAKGPDNLAGTSDDNLQLSAGSPVIDAGDNTALPADINDIDGNGDMKERIPWDHQDQPRFINDPLTADTGVAAPPDYPKVVDMGADEFTYIGDFNFSGAVDLSDLYILTGAWLTNPEDPQWQSVCDISNPPDDFINLWDYAEFAAHWLAGKY